MKMNDETESAYIVRQLRSNYEAAMALEAEARLKRETAFDAFHIAERAKDYLDGLAKKAGANDAR